MRSLKERSRRGDQQIFQGCRPLLSAAGYCSYLLPPPGSWVSDDSPRRSWLCWNTRPDIAPSRRRLPCRDATGPANAQRIFELDVSLYRDQRAIVELNILRPGSVATFIFIRPLSGRAAISAEAPADMLAHALRVRPSTMALARAERRHDPEGQVAVAEAKRGEAHRALVAVLRDRYGSGSRKLVLKLVLSIDPRTMAFDPRRVTPVTVIGRVFGMLSARGPWGSLQVRDGALVSADFSQVTVADPAADGLSGPGWTLSLAPGYGISDADEDGALRVLPPQAQ